MSLDQSIREYNGVSKENPVIMKNSVGKVVEIKTKYNKIIKGTVVTIDPVSESHILAVSCDNGISMTLVLGRYVKDVKFIDELPIVFNLKCSSQSESVDKENQMKALIKLKKWLEKNMVPVVQDEDVLKISDSLFIYPPYRPEDVICSNEMVLHKILGIIESLPKDI